jgi:hypothetical protein
MIEKINREEDEVIKPVYPRIILGLDISTSCIGAVIVKDDGADNPPELLRMMHLSPKINDKYKGLEALFKRKEIFENQFISPLRDYGITDVVIEEPLLTANNAMTVATLLRYNGIIAESVYRVLGIMPSFISSYDARMYSFPELVSLRKFNKRSEQYSLKHVLDAIKKNHIVLFGSYPFDVDKKSIMMNMVNGVYDEIQWVYNKNGELLKQNYDACDALICALAYININHYGLESPQIANVNIEKNEENAIINYDITIWNKTYHKKLILDI